MATRLTYTRFVFLLVVLLAMCSVSCAEKSLKLQLKCEEVQIRITAKRQLFEEKRVPFKPEYLRLGMNSTQQRSCRPEEPMSESEMVISAGLQDCGTKSSVRGVK